MRGELDNALAALKLFSKDDRQRMEGVKVLLKEPDEARLPLVEKALAAERTRPSSTQLELARAAALLGSSDKARRLDAARAMGQSKTPETKLLLNERMKAEADPAVKAQLEASLRAIEGHWPGATSSAPCSRASAWAPSFCWWRSVWPSPTD
jgi:urea transport system permease protein